MLAIVASTDNSNLLVQLLLGGFGVSGVVGAVVAIYKLRPDVNSQAVVQAQGAMESMPSLNEDLTKDRSYWRDRAIAAERECAKRTRALEEERDRLTKVLEEERKHFREMLAGMRLWDEHHNPEPPPD